MTKYYVDGAEWCVLFDRDLAFNKREYQFHCEPYYRFTDCPPNGKWHLLKRFLTEYDAFTYIECGLAQDAVENILGFCGYESSENNQCSTTSRSISKGVRFDVLARDSFKCRICGRGADDGVTLEVDHRYPKSKGGSDNISNLWTLCCDCNIGKSAKIIDSIINCWQPVQR